MQKIDQDENDTIYCGKRSLRKSSSFNKIEKKCHEVNIDDLIIKSKRESIFTICDDNYSTLDAMIGSTESLKAHNNTTLLQPKYQTASINEHKLLVEIADMNLIEMTRQLYFNKKNDKLQHDLCYLSMNRQDLISFDSGYCSNSRRISHGLPLSIEIPSAIINTNDLHSPASVLSEGSLTSITSPLSYSIPSFDMYKTSTMTTSIPNTFTDNLVSRLLMPTNNLIKNFNLVHFSKSSMRLFKQTMFKMFYFKKMKEHMKSVTNDESINSVNFEYPFHMDNSILSLQQENNTTVTKSSKKARKNTTLKRILSKTAKSIQDTSCMSDESSTNNISINTLLNAASFSLASNFCRITPKFLLRLYDVNFF